jgi:uroporphyrinogen decarboxylase
MGSAPFSPLLGDGNLKEAKEKSEGKFTIIGNIDQVNILKNGSIDTIKKNTEETIKIGKQGGRFILQSADYLEYDTPIKNIEAYIETGIKYGGY